VSVEQARLTAWVEGRVQGVGFRWWVRARALALGLAGWAENLADGRVKVVAEGPATACRELLAMLEGDDTPGRVARVTHRWDEVLGGLSDFVECLLPVRQSPAAQRDLHVRQLDRIPRAVGP
jgi:acylphosphatase